MQRDQQVEVMDVPQDGYGAGFIEHSIRSSYRDLCRIIGTENARATVTEIMDAEPRKRITIDG
ncbi:hypothetical protein [Mesorhizobium sp. M1A.F.Ca.IN.020.04.1.1]|uniref:hypothetical protein n=1 Tax=Mesorhizobium sp. M1A.F.Ca.IN.020.04.1.1 TaxID=2496761 RepID=UPI000FCBD29F|nr:hypothetical protein [Mesorhizobium sp. M1A.F.Ca.IN.020.04.1.1]RUW04020.1 hypothetical protein EOA49_00380 [Mesorhizobium sp. M1A.F.Ca.IN.020.04.1.1]RUW04083.1 hypothetical protein EOA49_00715 [Mesorhizobium sp. M1A.F.Ca.IN.020.04.1.1]